MSISWRPGQRRIRFPGDLEVPDKPEDLLALLRPRDPKVGRALGRTLWRRRALLTGNRHERRRQP